VIHIGLFEGMGGFSLASQWMGWQTYATCEIKEFNKKILNYYWPKAYHHSDIFDFTYATVNNEISKRFGALWRNDDIILTGGFP
jgi:site-specific DNA-cytosine methylase